MNNEIESPPGLEEESKFAKEIQKPIHFENKILNIIP